jgi:hypothetical protein
MVFLWGSAAEAKSVFLNEVNIDGVVGQHFDNCAIDIDAQGNVHITARGYKVEVQKPQQATPPPPQTAVSKRYWLVTENRSPGMDQYDIEVLINNQTVKKIASKDESVYLEITRYVHAGDNSVYIIAKKNLDGGQRRSTSPYHSTRVIIGEGTVNEKTIVIDKQLLDYRRNAGETQNFSDPFTIEAH